MRKALLIVLCLATWADAKGPKFQFKDPKLNAEMDNIYHDISKGMSSTGISPSSVATYYVPYSNRDFKASSPLPSQQTPVFDNFNRTNRVLIGDYATTGQQWSTTGSGYLDAVISSGMYTCTTDNVYASLDYGTTVYRIAGAFSFLPGSGANTASESIMALLLDRNNIWLNNILHLDFSPDAWVLTKRLSGGSFVPLLSGSWNLKTDGTVYGIAFEVRGTTITVYPPLGESKWTSDDDVATVNPRYGVWQILPTANSYLMRWHMVSLGPDLSAAQRAIGLGAAIGETTLTPGGGGASTLEVMANGVRVTSPTASINFVGTGVTGGSTDSTATITIAGSGMSPGASYYIQQGNTLQTGATFYVSSGTVAGNLYVSSITANTALIISSLVSTYIPYANASKKLVGDAALTFEPFYKNLLVGSSASELTTPSILVQDDSGRYGGFSVSTASNDLVSGISAGEMSIKASNSSATSKIFIGAGTTSNIPVLVVSQSNADNSKVGISTSIPQATLDVNGNILVNGPGISTFTYNVRVGSITYADGTIQATAFSSGSTYTWTSQQNFSNVSPSTFTALAISGLTSKSCLGTSASGLIQEGTCSGGATWGSITGTLSAQSDLQTLFNNVGNSTASLKTSLGTVTTDTTTIASNLSTEITNRVTGDNNLGASTGTLKTSIDNLGASTGTLQTSINNLGISTGSMNVPTVYKLTADSTTTGVAIASSPIVLSMLAASTYYLDCNILILSTTTTTGVGLGLNVPNNMAGIAYTAEIPLAADAAAGMWFGWGTSTNDMIVATAIPVASVSMVAHIYGVLQTGGTAGNITVLFRSELAANNATLKAGSLCKILKNPT